jgi:hypothetical protein
MAAPFAFDHVVGVGRSPPSAAHSVRGRAIRPLQFVDRYERCDQKGQKMGEMYLYAQCK